MENTSRKNLEHSHRHLEKIADSFAHTITDAEDDGLDKKIVDILDKHLNEIRELDENIFNEIKSCSYIADKRK